MKINQFFLSKKIYENKKNDLDLNIQILKQLTNKNTEYSTKNVNDKIDYLKSEFIKLNLIENINKFINFVDSRKNISGNSHTVSNEKFLKYLETFYFILTTTDKYSSLSENDRLNLKKELNQEVFNAIQCDIGLETKINQLLAQYLKTKNWITSLSHEYRVNILKRISGLYNTEHTQGVGYEIHTLKIGYQYAAQINLGVESYSQINDVYIDAYIKQIITSFFQQHMFDYINEYENTFIDNLLHYLNYQLHELIKQNKDKDIAYKKFCTVYFSEQDLANFYKIKDDDDIEYLLIDNRSEIQEILKKLLIKKLKKDEYLLPVNQNNIDNISIRCKNTATENKFKNFLYDALDAKTKKNKLEIKLSFEELQKNLNLLTDQQKLLLDNIFLDYKIDTVLSTSTNNMLKTIKTQHILFDALKILSNRLTPKELLTNNITIDKITHSSVKAFDLVLKNFYPIEYLQWNADKDFIKFKSAISNNNNDYEALNLNYHALKAIKNNNNWADALAEFQDSMPINYGRFYSIASVKNQLYTSLIFLKRLIHKIILLLNLTTPIILSLGYYALLAASIFSLQIPIYLNVYAIYALVGLSACLFIKTIFSALNQSAVPEKISGIFLIMNLAYLLSCALGFKFDFLVFFTLVVLPEIFQLLISSFTFIYDSRNGYINNIDYTVMNSIFDILFLPLFLLINHLLRIALIMIFNNFADNELNNIPSIKAILNCLINIIIPLIVRPIYNIINLFQNRPKPSLLYDLIISIEQIISNVDEKNDQSSCEKSLLLKKLWLAVQADFIELDAHQQTAEKLSELLNKKYDIEVADKTEKISFYEVSASQKVTGQELCLNHSQGFFKTNTSASQLHKSSYLPSAC